jgi:transposase
VAAKAKSRQYPTVFKLKAIKRAEEGVLPVARKLGISRKLLHELDQGVESPWS